MSYDPIELKSIQPEKFLNLVEGAVRSLENDIERYVVRLRDFETQRFYVFVGIFIIYATVAILVLQITLDKNINTVVSLFGEEFSKRIVTGLVIIFFGFLIVVQILRRMISARSAMRLMRNHLKLKLKFAEDLLRRATTWEESFDGDYYIGSIVRLHLNSLIQMTDELRLLTADSDSSTLPRVIRLLMGS